MRRLERGARPTVLYEVDALKEPYIGLLTLAETKVDMEERRSLEIEDELTRQIVDELESEIIDEAADEDDGDTERNSMRLCEIDVSGDGDWVETATFDGGNDQCA